jgi:hypothetical protein
LTRLLVACGLASLVLAAPVRYTNSDARATLPSAQALVERGSLRLDEELQGLDPADVLGGRWQVHAIGGHVYGRYPIGPVLVAAPAVWLARHLGLDMLREEDDAALQAVLAAGSVALTFLLLEALAALWLSPLAALSLALLSVAGSTLLSTLGSAFWTHDTLVPSTLGALLLVARAEQAARRLRRGEALLIGLLLALACLSRPTAIVTCACLGLFLWYRQRAALGPAALVLGVCLASYVVLNQVTLGMPLPPYYQPARWPAGADLRGTLVALLTSPSRGLLVYSPFLLAALSGLLDPACRRQPLYRLGLASTALHLLMVARQVNWWGGWCFGPRLLTDLLPGLLLALVLSVAAWPRLSWPAIVRGAALGSFGLAAVFSVWVHVRQGLFSWGPYNWNDAPAIDSAPQRLQDWRRPQFLATSARLERWRRLDAQSEAFEAWLRQVPDGAALLLPGNRADVVTLMRELAQRGRIGRRRLFRDLGRLRAAGFDDFHVPPGLAPLFAGVGSCRAVLETRQVSAALAEAPVWVRCAPVRRP